MRKTVIFLLFLALFLTGCWDRREIEQRGFVVGLGLDTAPMKENQELEPAGDEGFEVVVQVVMPSQVAGGPQSAGGGGEKIQPFWNIVSEGSSVLDAIRETSTWVYRAPYFAFTQVVVLGEDLARRGIGEGIDVLLRDAEMRRRVVVYVSAGRAKKVMDIQPRQEPVNGIYLGRLALNQTMTNKIPPPMDLGELGRALHENRAFLLPRVVPGDQDVKLAGAAVFRGDRMLGWLGQEHAEIQRWITNRVKAGTVTVLVEGEEVVYDVGEAVTTVMPEVEGEKVKFCIKVRTEGMVGEKQSTASDALQPQFLYLVQEKVSEQLERMIRSTVRQVMEQYGVDIFGFGQALERRNPGIWRELEPRWDEVFPTVAVEVEVSTAIRRNQLER